jgi:transglutaminase-like putative cysteine protease
MRASVAHVSRLEYDADVFESIMDVRLGPLDDADQHVERFHLRLEPGGHARQYVDGFGNVAHLLTSTRPHSAVEVSVRSEVETALVDPFALPVHGLGTLDVMERADGLDPSPLIPPLDELGRMASPFRSLDPFEAVLRMCEMINRQFTYRQGVTDVTTTVEQILDVRLGVCQDFAHLLIGLCRALSIPARYVSGYIVTADAPAAPHRGEGASHAWVEAFTPSHGWRGFDPTNTLVANAYYVKVARGRDYADVPPTRGTYRGAANETLAVSVITRVLA